jgi:carbon monoxide dehydrogenase subunit G
MTVKVSISLEYQLEVKAKFADVFELLSNVPESAGYYPKVDKLVDEGKGVYRWEMEKIGVASINLQTIYASKYVADKAKGTITWTPAKSAGTNADVSGSWKLKDNKKSTAITLNVEGDLSIPLPGLMKMVVTPIVEAEFEKMTDKYIANLTKKFGGEV